MEIKAKHIFYVGAFIVLTIIGIFLVPKNEEFVNESLFLNANDEVSGEMIYVHIIGAINNPGIMEVPKYTRLFELIELAGGTTDNADISRLNLASVLKDEQKIVVPEIINKNDITKESGIISKNTTTSAIININTSTKEELITLPGIGTAMAQRIVDYRDNNGLFNDIDEVKNVSRHWRSKV